MVISGVTGATCGVVADAMLVGTRIAHMTAPRSTKREVLMATSSSLRQPGGNSWEQNRNFHRHVVLRD